MTLPSQLPVDVLVDMVTYSADAADIPEYNANALAEEFRERLLKELEGQILVLVKAEEGITQ